MRGTAYCHVLLNTAYIASLLRLSLAFERVCYFNVLRGGQLCWTAFNASSYRLCYACACAGADVSVALATLRWRLLTTVSSCFTTCVRSTVVRHFFIFLLTLRRLTFCTNLLRFARCVLHCKTRYDSRAYMRVSRLHFNIPFTPLAYCCLSPFYAGPFTDVLTLAVTQHRF